jgi:transcriptional regulator with XRE-family HTH domain
MVTARARADMSQREIAEAAHIAASTIAGIESGTRRQPSLPVLARILAAIDLEMRIMLAACVNQDDASVKRSDMAAKTLDELLPSCELPPSRVAAAGVQAP